MLRYDIDWLHTLKVCFEVVFVQGRNIVNGSFKSVNMAAYKCGYDIRRVNNKIMTKSIDNIYKHSSLCTSRCQRNK